MLDRILLAIRAFPLVVPVVVAIGAALMAGPRRLGIAERAKIVMFVVGLLLLVVAFLAVILILKQGPQFEVSFLYALGDDHATEYEVTNMLLWDGGLSDEYWIEQTGVLVRPIYVPSNFGSVEVTVLGKDGRPLLEKPWQWDLTNDPGPQNIPIPLSKLIEVSELKVNRSRYGVNVFEEPGGFRFEQAKISVQLNRFGTTQSLHDETLAIVNTPWYHHTTLSTMYPWAGDQITAYVRGHNVGGPSDFNLICNLWCVDSTIAWERDWGIGGAWQRVSNDNVIKKDVRMGQAFNTKCTLPTPEDTFSFGEPGVFAFETYLVKKQNYAVPKHGEFFGSEQQWEFQDPSDVFVIVMKKSE